MPNKIRPNQAGPGVSLDEAAVCGSTLHLPVETETKLAQLHDQGVLSDADYEAAKRRVLEQK